MTCARCLCDWCWICGKKCDVNEHWNSKNLKSLLFGCPGLQMVDKSNTMILLLILLVWLLNAVAFAIVPVLVAIVAGFVIPGHLADTWSCVSWGWRRVLLVIALYLITFPIVMSLTLLIAVIASVCLLVVMTPALTLYCPYMALRIIYYSLKWFK